ncbi:MAG: hypothetical protein M1836_003686 [Candelina mexicana]|nr:MAG: hypothetical protein M1836_003686 [Candelina mexicana]
MSQPDPVSQLSSSQELSKVNTLYGPGTILGWYITILAVIISWTLHPKKRRPDSLSVDLIAVLTLPSVALVHFISLMRHQRSWRIRDKPYSKSLYHWDESLRREQFAAYAPFHVMRAFLHISFVLYFTSRPLVCVKRSSLVLWLALACANPILMFSHMFLMDIGGPNYHDGGPIVIDWVNWLVPLWVPGIFSFLMLPCICVDNMGIGFISSNEWDGDEALPINNTEEIESQDTNCPRDHVPTYLEQGVATWNFIMPPVCIFATIMLTPGFLISQTRRSKVLAFIFPESNSSLNDLDQAVAACAGASVLLFNLYSAASALYKYRNQRRRHLRGRRPDERTPLMPTAMHTERTSQREGPFLPNDYELESIRSSPSTGGRSCEQRSESTISGALGHEYVGQEEVGATLPMASSRNQQPQASLHVRWADQEESMV